MDTTLDACPSSPPSLLRPSSSERLDFSSSPPLDTPQEASLPTTPTPRPRGTAVDFIQADWTLWGRQEWSRWPGFERYAGRQETRAWWQDYGYRVEDHSTRRQGNKLRWICAETLTS